MPSSFVPETEVGSRPRLLLELGRSCKVGVDRAGGRVSRGVLSAHVVLDDMSPHSAQPLPASTCSDWAAFVKPTWTPARVSKVCAF